jgi:hypothetical protein
VKLPPARHAPLVAIYPVWVIFGCANPSAAAA